MSTPEQADILAEVYGSWLQRVAPDLPAALQVAARQLFDAMAEGHVCISVDSGQLDGIDSEWLGGPGAYAPFILDGPRLYLARYHDHEQAVAASLDARARLSCPVADSAVLRQELARLFTTENPHDKQRLAVLVAQFKPLTLISGGPGTGKTSTVVNLLALLLVRDPALRIGLAAPTGKAAQRMVEAIATAKDYLAASTETKALIPAAASTLHRLLGALGDTGRFRHHAQNPLALDVLVIDEASMIDLAMMRAILAALPPGCRLILLGDKDQLASVEAGSVFGDICSVQGMSADFLAQLQPFGIAAGAVSQGPALGNCRVELTHSYRFAAESGIGRLAAAARAGDVAAFMDVYEKGASDIAWEQGSKVSDAGFAALIQAGFADYLAAVQSADAATAFKSFQQFRLLCAHRKGSAGVDGLNRQVQKLLHLGGGQAWYAGRPVMITANDYVLRLFNGDIGICLPAADGLRVFFEGEGGIYRALLPARVPAHETAYAMTVHKSQGSEFERVLLVLPEVLTPILNRPLIYTAITRAKKYFTLWALPAVAAAALASLPQRDSGLRERLLRP
jgi:exodeoxyribonuclease V alpha subunit